MNLPATRSGIGIAAILLAAGLAFAPSLWAQAQKGGQSDQQQSANPPAGQNAPAAAQKPAEAPKPVDPEEEKAYKAIIDMPTQNNDDKQIQMGEQFLLKYPNSNYAETVYAHLTQAYFNKGQIEKMYASADGALRINQNNVTALVLVGWVIPHNYDPNDMDSERRLNKAEIYEKHALDVLAALPKPANLTDDQFTKSKSETLSQAHSALGLIYFRRQDFENSVKEMQLGVQVPDPDPADFYIMGIDQQQLKHYSESADAYTKCSQIPGPFQDNCKQGADQSKKLAVAQPKP